MWPPFSQFASKAFAVPLDDEDEPIYLSVHLVSYEPRPRPELRPTQRPEQDAGPIIWRGVMDTGYWLGPVFVKAPEEVVKIDIEHTSPYQGEVDIQLHIGARSEVPEAQLEGLASSLSYSVLSYINVAMRDLLVPVAPIQVRRLLEQQQSTFANKVTVTVKDRKQFSTELLAEELDKFVDLRSRLSEEEKVALDAAMRRYLSSLTEMDVVDKFCDLWEVCEFATYNVKAKGGTVGRISQTLNEQMRLLGIQRSKAAVENTLQIKTLSEVRGDLVHNALAKPRELEERTALLNSIALELLRFRLKLPYQRPDSLENRFDSCLNALE